GDLEVLLTDGDVDADQVLAALVDDRIQGNSGLAGLPVANDQFTLPAPDGNHGVDSLDACLDGDSHGFAGNDARSHALDGAVPGGVDWTGIVNRFAQRVDHAPKQGVAHRHRHDAAC